MSSDDVTRRSTLQHHHKEQSKRDRWSRQERITDSIEKAARALGRAGEIDEVGGEKYYQFVFDECRHRLAPELRQHIGGSLLDYWSHIESRDRTRYDHLDALTSRQPQGFDPAEVGSRRYVIGVFRALVTIAEHEDLIADEKRSRADVENFTLKVGEHLQDWDMDLGDPVRGVALDTEAMKTLFCGGTGDGKSTALETEAEDYYQQNVREGRDYKLLDIVDIDKGENWFYDIPQQQPKLRRIRDEMGLPESFADGDDLEQPSVEVLLPITPGLSTDELPFDTDAESFSARPFSVPASDFPKRILIPCIMSRLSDSEEQTVRQAYDDVDRRKNDWSLRDLADEIRDRDELSPKHKADAVGVLRSLQDLGFIRTRDDPHTLNWDRIFRTTKTITIFSQAKIDTELGKYLCIAYLLDKILDLRQSTYGLADAVLLMRELWEVTPQRGRLSPDERAAAVQESIANRMGKVMRKLRHFDLHLIADTQEPGDLHKQVREMFNRYVVFQSSRDTVDDIFKWTSNDRRGSFWGTLNQKKGQAGIVGKVEPAVQERDIEFLSPVAFAPPSHHHYDKYQDTNGWETRANRIESEELRCPIDIDGVEWHDEIPPHLTIKSSVEDDGPDVTMRPVAAFCERCLEQTGDDEYVLKAEVRQVFNSFLEKHDRDPWDFDKKQKQTTFGDRVSKHYPDDAYESRQRSRDGVRHTAYVGLTFSKRGKRLRKDAVGEAARTT